MKGSPVESFSAAFQINKFNQGKTMAYILAIFLPFLAVMLKKRVGVGIVLLILQLTIVGWFIASIVAFFIIHGENTKKAIADAMAKEPN